MQTVVNDLFQLDLDGSLEDQGPFDLILHKMTDQIGKANQGNNIAKSRVQRFCVSMRVEKFCGVWRVGHADGCGVWSVVVGGWGRGQDRLCRVRGGDEQR